MSKYIIELDENAKEVVVISLEDGDMWTETMEVEDLEQLNSDYINEHFGELQDTAYQRGLEEGKAQAERGCKGCEYEGKTGEHLPCEYCKNNFRSQWTAKDDKFEFGDEIIDSNGAKGCVVSKDNEVCDMMYALFDGYRVPQHITQKKYRKTGKRYDIEKILEAMKA